MKFCSYLLLPVFLFLPVEALAEIITFDFEGTAGTDLDGLPAGTTSVTSGGITLTLSASIGATSDGFFNLIGAGFGINNTGTDETAAFDADFTAMPMPLIDAADFTVTSNVALLDLELVSLEFDRFTAAASDEGGLTVNGAVIGSHGPTFEDSELDGSNVLTVNEAGLTAADTISLSYVAGNGFGLEFITFDATAAPIATVPEPGTAFGAAVLCIGFLFLRRRNLQRGHA